MKAIGYSRISTVDQSEYSLDFQERMIREYCERNKLALAAVFKDDGQSSYTFDRPDFKALEAFIKKNKDVTHLIILDHDRFSRNLAEALMKIQELQSKFGIKVLATSDNFDTDFADPSNFMMRAFKLMMAEGELHNIRRRTKNGIVQAALSGRWTNMAPYGYKNIRNAEKKAVLEMEPEQAAIVRMIFREYLAGADINQVKIMAVEKGYKQRSKSAIQRILTNPAYAGLVPVPPHKGRRKAYAQGIHVPIISEQDFWLVQERFTGKKKGVHSREDVFLRGALHCWCGRLVTAGNSRSKTGAYHWYYLCQEHRQNLPARKLHEQFGQLLETLSISPARLEWLREKLSTDIGQRIQQQGEEAIRLAKELKQLQLQIKSTERRFLTVGNVSEEMFKEVMTEFRADEVRLQRALATQGSDQTVYFERLNNLLGQLVNLREAFEKLSLEKQHQFINMGFDNNFYYRDGSYRTHAVHPALSDNLMEANEKGLLKIEKPIKKLGEIPSVPGTGPVSNSFFDKTMQLLELIA